MIIDFRIRPPFKSFLSLSMYGQSKPPKNSRYESPFTWDCGPVPSAELKSIELLISEMDDAGIDQGVIMGRQAGSKYGFVLNDDVAELGHRYPERFHLFGGVCLNDVSAAIDEVQRVIGEMGFKGNAFIQFTKSANHLEQFCHYLLAYFLDQILAM